MFKFRGVSNIDMGVYAKEENFLGKAPLKVEKFSIDGKNGSYYVENGYDDFSSSLSEVTFIQDNIEESISWLSGEGILEYNDRKTIIKFYDSYAVKNGRKPFSIGFIRHPFWYKLEDNFELPTSGVIKNDGTTSSLPIILIEKNTSNECEFKVNGIQFTYTFDTEGFVLIDCETCNATFDGMYRNRNLKIGFEFPKLQPGDNLVQVIKGDAIIKFKRKDVWL